MKTQLYLTHLNYSTDSELQCLGQLRVWVDENDSISGVKKRIQIATGLGVKQMTYRGKAMRGDTISSFIPCMEGGASKLEIPRLVVLTNPILIKSAQYCKGPASGADKSVNQQFFIRSMTDGTFTIYAEPTDTIMAIKRKIATRTSEKLFL